MTYVGIPVPKALDGKGSPTSLKLMFLTKLDLTKRMGPSKISGGVT